VAATQGDCLVAARLITSMFACRAAVLVVAALLTGCGWFAPQVSNPSPPSQSMPTPTPTSASSGCPGSHEVPTLEERLPATLNGQALCRQSLGGFTDEGEVGEKFNVGALLIISLVRETHASLSDVSFAMAGIDDPSAGLQDLWVIGAFHVDGVGADELRAAFLAPYIRFGTEDLREVTIADHPVTRIISTTIPSQLTFVWTVDQVLYYADGLDRGEVEEVLRSEAVN
jgi:hypothetical protein